jgi:hypothetical protein
MRACPTRSASAPGPLGFLAAETRESMMHVGALMQFSPVAKGCTRGLPRGADGRDQARGDHRAPVEPQAAHPELLMSPLQAWVEDTHFDAEYHVRRSALPRPGGERELGILVSRLHSHSIDFHRPPWEVHFIEGLGAGASRSTSRCTTRWWTGTPACGCSRAASRATRRSSTRPCSSSAAIRRARVTTRLRPPCRCCWSARAKSCRTRAAANALSACLSAQGSGTTAT